MIYMDGALLEEEIRDMLSKIRGVLRQRYIDEPFRSSSISYKGLMIWSDEKEYIVDDPKGVLPPELKYIADGRKRNY